MKEFSVSDEEIVERFFERNENAVSLVEKKYGKYFFSIAKNILGDEEDSRECVNDVLFHLWTHIPPDHPVCFKAYVSHLVRNLAIDRKREQSKKRRIPSEMIASLDELYEFLESESNTEKAFDDIQLKECLERFVESLGKRQQFIFICRYFSCYKIAEIAEFLNLKERIVFKELSQMKQSLRNQLIREGFIHG